MLDYASLYSAAMQLPVPDQIRLIDALTAALPKDAPKETSDYEELAIADALRDIDEHPDELRRALERRGGVTTAQMLRNLQAAAERAARQ
jgi:hypothetical protein